MYGIFRHRFFERLHLIWFLLLLYGFCCNFAVVIKNEPWRGGRWRRKREAEQPKSGSRRVCYQMDYTPIDHHSYNLALEVITHLITVLTGSILIPVYVGHLNGSLKEGALAILQIGVGSLMLLVSAPILGFLLYSHWHSSIRAQVWRTVLTGAVLAALGLSAVIFLIEAETTAPHQVTQFFLLISFFG